MEELIKVMIDVRDQLAELNSKINSLTRFGAHDIGDIISAVESIKGSTGSDLTDILNKLDEIDSSLGTIDRSLGTIGTSITVKD